MSLEVRGVSKLYGSVKALDNLSLTVPDGNFTCFLGPSGCGKTTLLRIIAGLESADSGQITLGMNDLSQTQPSERNFGVVFQSYSLFPNLSALKNVMYGLECRAWPKAKAKARAMEMLDLVHLADQADKLPSQMSGGQQQRVAIARAIAPQPSLLLLDEPLSALDAKVRAELRSEVRKIQQDIGITTIMVTHDQSEALEMADQIVVLRGGQVEQVGTARELYHHPRTEFVANFIGTINSLAVEPNDKGSLMFGSAPLVVPDSQGSIRKLGVRPEAVTISSSPAKTDNSLAGIAKTVRFLGNYNVVEVAPDCAPDQIISAELRGDLALPSEGDAVYVNFNSEQLRELQA
ncbi:ATP-binding cassette domain-containing protein [Rhodobacteraceae bacterium RKSG542]|uniref:ABC transporter ATP-binding protein n=1 Tax=Pseudovibrio flavus TaxID=2529854 RepID=UPI0012BCAA66|nr:ATP-binding cassette domain-containing protein [Pseudovibrio flavus]MTI18183.1 ATP-binding cassette domain-containing protein [Pseudovibrio flavus]